MDEGKLGKASKLSQQALMEKARSLRRQAQQSSDLSMKQTLKAVAKGYEILAEKAPGEETD